MKIIKMLTLTAAIAATLCASASAHLIDLGTFTTATAIGSPSDETAYVSTNFNGGNPLTFLTKAQGDPASFSGAGDNPAIANGGDFFTVTGANGTTATISWDLTTSGFQLNFVLLKDGEDENGQQLYHIYQVSSDEVFKSGSPQLVTINGLKNISHITFMGNPGTPSTPDGGMTVTLLGISAVGLEFLRRRLIKS
jgi:hypothetical protein